MDEIRAAWEKLDETADVMKQLILQGDDELIDIHCGMDKYTLPRSLLEFEDSYLGALFRGENGITLQTDAENYLVLDVDPDCWKILVQFPRLFSGRDWGFGVGRSRLIKFWRARSRLYRRLR